ncbi:MAG: uncharacterized protein KVP18_003971 [Porospora cf. gigantea A]|uniref:uncharacterized protein n=1 Tax=Porospora cf. gigantea A TaxID=2853593 RepID=UPI0035596EC8|nr:MAG: hypothetical protein KVP18_003971 [Porospora cf. gigantea A]
MRENDQVVIVLRDAEVVDVREETPTVSRAPKPENPAKEKLRSLYTTSYQSFISVYSLWSLVSFACALCMFSALSSASIMSCMSFASVMSNMSSFSILSHRSFFAIGCVNDSWKICL